MPFMDVNSPLKQLLFDFKQYKNLTKSTIEILPSSGQTAYSGGSKISFTLPYASAISLEDLAFSFDFQCTDSSGSAGILKGTTSAIAGHPLCGTFGPKDISSIIEEVDVKVNGQTIQHLTSYNDLVNLMNFLQDEKSVSKLLQNTDITNKSMVSEISNKVVVTKFDKGFEFDRGATVVQNEDYLSDKRTFIINQWFGLLGKRGKETSSNFIDTNMLGEVVISFVLAKPNVLFYGLGKEVSVPSSDYATDFASLKLTENIGYTLKNCKLSMVRYNFPSSYSDSIASQLNSGTKYTIAFNHYETRNTNALESNGTIRWNENSRDIKHIIAYFTNSNRHNSIKPSDYNEVAETSNYFNYGNVHHKNSQFQVGSVMMPQNAQNTTDSFLELTRAIPEMRGNKKHEMFNKIQTVDEWANTCFMAYLSLEMTEGVKFDESKLLSGLSSEQLPISMVYKYTNNPIGSSDSWAKNVNVMTVSTRLLVVEKGQNCYVEI